MSALCQQFLGRPALKQVSSRKVARSHFSSTGTWGSSSPSVSPLLHDEAVLSHADLLDVQHPAHRGEDRDFILQRTQLAGGDRVEARVPQGSERGHVPNGSRRAA